MGRFDLWSILQGQMTIAKLENACYLFIIVLLDVKLTYRLSWGGHGGRVVTPLRPGFDPRHGLKWESW